MNPNPKIKGGGRLPKGSRRRCWPQAATGSSSEMCRLARARTLAAAPSTAPTDGVFPRTLVVAREPPPCRNREGRSLPPWEHLAARSHLAKGTGKHRSTELRAGQSCTQLRREALTGVVLLHGGTRRRPSFVSRACPSTPSRADERVGRGQMRLGFGGRRPSAGFVPAGCVLNRWIEIQRPCSVGCLMGQAGHCEESGGDGLGRFWPVRNFFSPNIN